MDKLKPIIAAMAKHVFWAGCGLILIVSVLTWYMARGRLHEEFDKNLGDIGSKVSSVKQLRDKCSQNPPNQHSHEGMDKLLDGTLQLVVEAWEKQYSHQKNILKWSSFLEDDFIAEVRDLKPIELKVGYPTLQEQKLDVDLRQRYWNYVDELLPKLAEAVDSQWMPKGADQGMGGAGGMMTPAMRSKARATKPPVVVWDPQDQTRLAGTHFNWPGAPTTLQVLYAQEDLWVLEALVRIIAKTNGNIESRHEAVVKTIESIMIGRGVTGRAGQVMRVGSGGGMSGDGMSGDGMYGDGGSSPVGMDEAGDDMDESSIGGGMPVPDSGMASSPSGMDTGGPGVGGAGATRLSADPADGRYVDNDYTPLRGSRIREAMKASNPADAFLVVAKRMPIRLRLVVDQRKLHRLLAECGNSPLPVEIRQVRLNRGKSSGGYDMGGGSGGYGDGDGGSLGGGLGLGGGGYGGGMGEPSYDEGMTGEDYSPDDGGGYPSHGGPGAFGPSLGDLKNRSQISSTTSHDVPVELYGIIYIYNPPDQDRLGIEQAQEGLTGTMQPDASAPG